MLRVTPGAWVDRLVDHKFVVTHVVGKAVEHQFVVKQSFELLLQCGLIHGINLRDPRWPGENAHPTQDRSTT